MTTPATERQLRVLHAPLNTAGNPAALARAERDIGLDSWSVSWSKSPFGFATDEVVWAADMSWGEFQVARLRLIWRALRDYDVIHFNWGETLFPVYQPALSTRAQARTVGRSMLEVLQRQIEFRDLPLFRALGKVIAVTFQGDDARQGDYIGAHFEISPAPHVPHGYYTPESDRRKRRIISHFDNYADLIYSLNPDLLSVLPARSKFLSYASIDPREWLPLDRRPPNPVPVLVHAPSHREVKGTRFILDAVEQLRREKVPFEFVLVENMKHQEAKALYRRADILVDQLLVGFYGALAVELMALGTPTVAYLRDADLTFLPADMRAELPLINATPATIPDVLREVLTRPRNELAMLGRRGRAFVEKWYDPQKIAESTASDYREALASKGRRKQ